MSQASRISANTRGIRMILHTLRLSSLMLGAICLFAAEQATPPPEADILAQQQGVRALYKADYAAKDPAKRVALAQQLLQLASNGSPAERVALLREAAAVAAKAGELELARTALDNLIAGWRVDAAAERLALYQGATIATPEQALAAATDLLAACDAAIAADRYPTAQKLAEAAAGHARRAKDEAIAKRAKTAADEARDLGAEYAKITTGADLLGDSTPAQQAALGRFYGLGKGDWTKALPLLATGDDAALKAAAAADLAAKTPAEREAAGEAWAEIAKKAQTKQKPALYRRALDNLTQAADGATGLTRAKLDKRITELEALAGRPRGVASSVPAGVLLWLDGEPGPDGKSIVDASPNRLPLAAEGKTQLLREGHGGFMRFDASGHLSTKLKTPVAVTGSFTTAFWIRGAAKADTGGILGLNGDRVLLWKNKGWIAFHLSIADKDKGWYPQLPVGSVPPEVWHHIAFIADFTKKTQLWCVNGVPSTKTDAPDGPLAMPIDQLSVGEGKYGAVAADLDEFGFWNRALTPEEVKALHAASAKGR